MKALFALCEELMVEYQILPEKVRRHQDALQTDCPGSRFPYSWLQITLKKFATQHPEVRRPPAVLGPRLGDDDTDVSHPLDR